MRSNSSWMDTAHRNAGWVVAAGVLTVVAGVAMIFSPLAGGVAVTMVLGVSLLVGGVAGLFAAFGTDSFGSGALAFLWALLTAVAGFHIFTNPGIGLLTLTMVLAVMFFANGLMQTVAAFQMRPVEGWGWMLAGGVTSVILAFMVWRQLPFSGAWLVGTLAGIHMIQSGATTVMVGRAARSATKTDS